MAINVYPLPSGLAVSSRISTQPVAIVERTFWGGPSQITEVTPRTTARLEGIVHSVNAAAFSSWIDRMANGSALTAFPDRALRTRLGWDATPAINSSGTQYWRESGATKAFPGGTPTSPWRTADCQANGAASADATSIAVDGLLASETIKAGTPIRISGLWRYIVRTAVTANGSGEATLSLAHPLRASVADNATISIPGDLGVYRLDGEPEIGTADQQGVQPFSASFHEVYASEFTGGFTWVVD